MNFISTRDSKEKVSASYAIVKGISQNGGLYVPEEFPQISKEELEDMLDLDYVERSAFVISKYLTDYSIEELLTYTKEAYSRFYGDDPCPVVSVGDNTYILELWHGPTCAFKDIALTVLPHLMTAARDKLGETDKTLILVATSGDTGKAALEGFRDVEGCEIIVFYPSDGVSDMQKLQMQTQEGSNVYVCGINGNFDDAQNAVKSIFADENVVKELKSKGYKLSSANSINWGRLVPQIAYYVSAYIDLVNSENIDLGDKINFCVPTGNFGNILAGYYAMRMGLPINKLICASNENNVLTDFFASGEYDINRDFYKTISPSMDILISSNLERLLFEICGRDDVKVVELMKELKISGKYEIKRSAIAKHSTAFVGFTANEEETLSAIDNFYDMYDYLIDPHTAVAVAAYDTYVLKTNDETNTVIVSTASPFKFPSDVYYALTTNMIDDGKIACDKLHSATGEEIPQPIAELNNKKIIYQDIVEIDDIKNTVLKHINNKSRI